MMLPTCIQFNNSIVERSFCWKLARKTFTIAIKSLFSFFLFWNFVSYLVSFRLISNLQLHTRVRRWCVWWSKAVQIQLELFWNMSPIHRQYQWLFVMVLDVLQISSHLFTSKFCKTFSITLVWFTSNNNKSAFKESSVFVCVHSSNLIRQHDMAHWFFILSFVFHFFLTIGMHRMVKNKRSSNRCETIY